MTFCNLSQPEKARSPMLLTQSGIVSVSIKDLPNAYLPIVVILFGIIMLVICACFAFYNLYNIYQNNKIRKK